MINRSLPSSRWPIRYVAIIAALLGAPAAEAALVYALVDYPDLQNGYRLSGTITVSDSAPDDGLLATEEVLDWSWTAEGPWEVQGRLRSAPIVNRPPTQAVGIEIDSESIRLGDGLASRLSLEEITSADRRGQYGSNLYWWNVDAQNQRYGLFSYISDTGFDSWRASVPNVGSQSDHLLIATRVPEASACMMIVSAILHAFATANRRSR